MSITAMKVFNDFMYTTVNETVAQQVNLFNTATRGGIILKSARNVGDFAEDIFYTAFTTPVRRRDIYATGAVAAQAIGQATATKVKIAGAAGPFAFDPSQFTWIQKNPEEAAVVIGEQVSKAILQDYLNSALRAANAAFGANNSFDGSAGTMDLTDLNNGARLLGDKAQDLACWVMHSKPYFDLLGAAITNSNTLFTFGTIQVVTDGMGRPLVITDSPSLYLDAATDLYYTLGFVPGGAIVEDNGDFFANTETTNGDENINRTWQAEFTYNLGLKGFQWDKTNGGKSPTDAEVATATNWDKVATSTKNLGGVRVVTQ